MSLTLTKEEFECIRCTATNKFREIGIRVQRANSMGLESKTDDWKIAKKLFLYINIIWTWQQDEFTELAYFNYVNSQTIQNILAKIRNII